MTGLPQRFISRKQDQKLTSILSETFKVSPRLVDDYANALWAAFNQPGQFLELKHDEEALAYADYHLGQAASAMLQLSADTQREYQQSTTYKHFALINANSPTLADSIRSLTEIRTVIRSLQTEQRAHEFSGRKRNWPLISLTRMARRVWAAGNRVVDTESLGRPYQHSAHILLWRVSPSSGPALEYEDFLESFAPIAQKPNTPGPFGRFLEEILSALGVQSRSGGRMTASSALRAWRQVYRSTPENAAK